MTAKPTKSRVAALRERKRKAGLRPVQFWLTPAEEVEVRKKVKQLEGKRQNRS